MQVQAAGAVQTPQAPSTQAGSERMCAAPAALLLDGGARLCTQPAAACTPLCCSSGASGISGTPGLACSGLLCWRHGTRLQLLGAELRRGCPRVGSVQGNPSQEQPLLEALMVWGRRAAGAGQEGWLAVPLIEGWEGGQADKLDVGPRGRVAGACLVPFGANLGQHKPQEPRPHREPPQGVPKG